LDVYIDLAFYEISNIQKVHNAISLNAAVGVAIDRLDSLEKEAIDGHASLAEMIDEFKNMVTALKVDIKMAEK
jgi:hypothetical protein